MPAAFRPARDQIARMRPALYRMIVDWTYIQPDPRSPAILDANVDGCMRLRAPCRTFKGVEATLRALAARQRAGTGWNVVVTIYGVPEWAATRGGGCERDNIGYRSRAINAAGLRAYAQLVRRIAELGDRLGVELRFWSPWNEPNQIFFISPQRARCDESSPLLSPAVYTRLYRTARRALEDAGGERELVLGDLAGSPEKGVRAGKADEFLRALPRDVVCGSEVLALHSYPGNDFDVIAEAARVTDSRCGRRMPIWITETGAGNLRAGKERDVSASAVREQCRRYYDQLRAWRREPRVKVATQYLVREDPQFRVGLVTANMRREYPAFGMLTSWSRAAPGAVPRLPASCR